MQAVISTANSFNLMTNNSKNKKTPKVGSNILDPIKLEDDVKALCKKVDYFYKNYPKKHKNKQASDLIMGAFYASRDECRNNPDWMSQSAGSIRGVLYPLFSGQVSEDNLLKLFKKYLSNNNSNNSQFINTLAKLDILYNKFSDLSHHGVKLSGFSENDFKKFKDSNYEQLLKDFIYILDRVLSLQQIYIHGVVDVVCIRNKITQNLLKDLKLILSFNLDAKEYFFSKIDQRWINPLWDNGFLDVIKIKKEDPTKYGFRTPEINYLVRITEKKPELITKILLSNETASTKKNFNPEVVDQFLKICGILPVHQIKKVVDQKNISEWIELMNPFNHYGFEFEQMFKKLYEAGEFKYIVKLAKAILTIKSENDFKKDGIGIRSDDPFYQGNLAYTKVFEYLLKVDEENIEYALEVTVDVLSKIIKLAGKSEENQIFEYRDNLSLYDVDIFKLKAGEDRRVSLRDDEKELLAVIKELVDKTFSIYGLSEDSVKSIYKKCFERLPESPSTFRLKLYVLSIKPELFKDELKTSFDKFEVEDSKSYYDVVGGAEYEKALQKSFDILDEDYKNNYAGRVIKFFKKRYDKSISEGNEQKWHLGQGSDILSSISNYLKNKPDLINKAKSSGFLLYAEHEPRPSVGRMESGYVNPTSPISYEEISKLNIEEIVEKLKNELSPKELIKLNKGSDFRSPINAEGVGKIIQEDITNRLNLYLEKIDLFFDLEKIDQHYFYSLFRGLEGVLKNKKQELDKYNFDKLFTLFDKFAESKNTELFNKGRREREIYDSWLSNWSGVFSAMTDIFHALMDGDTKFDFKNYRDRTIKIISFLLKYPDPVEADENPETATSKSNRSGGSEMLVSDPFSMAINTVRGRAFQAFVMFVYKDGQKIGTDVKEIYTNVLKEEKTRAIMFMFGHYLQSFYYRDRDFVLENLDSIFPVDKNKQHLYLASWEGFLANNLFKEIFEEDNIKELYKRGLNTEDIVEDFRNYFKKPNESVAGHLALGYMFFGYKGDIYDEFWSEKTTTDQKAEFVHFLGSMFISGSNQEADKLIEENEDAKNRLIKMWDFILEKYKDEEKILSEMGMWFNTDKNIFDLKWMADHVKNTMVAVDGKIDWEYGLTKSVIELAKVSPEDVIIISRYFFINGGVKAGDQRRPWHVDREWYQALKEIFDNGDKEIKDKVYDLIDELIEEGGSPFWVLKEILGDYEK